MYASAMLDLYVILSCIRAMVGAFTQAMAHVLNGLARAARVSLREAVAMLSVADARTVVCGAERVCITAERRGCAVGGLPRRGRQPSVRPALTTRRSSPNRLPAAAAGLLPLRPVTAGPWWGSELAVSRSSTRSRSSCMTR